MLLDIKLTIKITNNGKDLNNTGVSVNQNTKISDALVGLKMAEKNILTGLENYITKKYGSISEKQFDKIYKSLSFAEMYEQSV